MPLSLESKPGAVAAGTYLEYTPAVEKPAPDERITFDELSRTMQHITISMAAKYRHAMRPVHAKSHGLLVGTLEVLPHLPLELAQGLFAKPASYPVVMRFSTNPGDLLADNVSTPRGLAVKVVGIEGEKVANHAGALTQDFVCVDSDFFPVPDPAGFLKQIQMLDKTLDVSEGVKHAISVSARAANAVLGVAGLHSTMLEGFGAPAVHILGESFTTVAPIRYGSYIAKVGFAPYSENLKALTGKGVDLDEDYNALSGHVKRFFHHESGVWDVKVQLALAPTSSGDERDNGFPIEDASKVWPHDLSPWQTVARIIVPSQSTCSDDRQRFVDEQMSFSPWHALELHRPLGGIMRSRLKAYEEASKYREQRNGRPRTEITSIDQVPA